MHKPLIHLTLLALLSACTAETGARPATECSQDLDCGLDALCQENTCVPNEPEPEPEPEPEASCARLELDGASITRAELPETRLGATSALSVSLYNCSESQTLSVSSLTIDGERFSAGGELHEALQSAPTLTLGAGERRRIQLTFAPTMEGAASGELQVGFGVDEQLKVALSGTGLATCIAPQIALSVGDAAPSMDEQGAAQIGEQLSLRALRTADTLRWSVLEQPLYGARLNLPPIQPEVLDLSPESAGEYVLQLESFEGAKSCGVDTVKLYITPAAQLHIELVKFGLNQVPGASDPRLELHLLHPQASAWNVAPWDIFAGNPTADWGVMGDASDDPRLSSLVSGNERLELDNLEPDTTYLIGVYHDAGATPSDDVSGYVNVYLGGDKVGYIRTLFNSGELTIVGELSTSDDMFRAMELRSVGFPPR
jgi:hypothetical protein